MPTINYTLTTAGHNLLRDGAKGAASPKISYAAIGTGSTTPTISDTRLSAEVLRKKITTYTNGASTGEVIISLYLAPGEAVGVTIAEVGFFGGNATGTVNSGVLLARGLYSPTHTKTNLESITFPLDLTT
jgi:hypothetical protein